MNGGEFIDGDHRTILHLIERFRLKTIDLGWEIPDRAQIILDHLSAYDWIEQYVKGGHDTPLGHMLDGACRGYFGLDTRTQSSLNLVYTFGSWFSEDEQDSEDDDHEHCSTSWQGYMEGGASEGARAAREILQDYGIR